MRKPIEQIIRLIEKVIRDAPVELGCLLDHSAAFNTIEHSILVNILQQDFGVLSTALKWFD